MGVFEWVLERPLFLGSSWYASQTFIYKNYFLRIVFTKLWPSHSSLAALLFIIVNKFFSDHFVLCITTLKQSSHSMGCIVYKSGTILKVVKGTCIILERLLNSFHDFFFLILCMFWGIHYNLSKRQKGKEGIFNKDLDIV